MVFSLALFMAFVIAVPQEVRAEDVDEFGLRKISIKLKSKKKRKLKIKGKKITFHEYGKGKKPELKVKIPKGTDLLFIKGQICFMNKHDNELNKWKVNKTVIEKFNVYAYSNFKARWYTPVIKNDNIDKAGWPDKCGKFSFQFKVDTKKKKLSYVKPKNRGQIKISGFNGKSVTLKLDHGLKKDIKNQSFALAGVKAMVSIDAGPSSYLLQFQDQYKDQIEGIKDFRARAEGRLKESQKNYLTMTRRIKGLKEELKKELQKELKKTALKKEMTKKTTSLSKAYKKQAKKLAKLEKEKKKLQKKYAKQLKKYTKQAKKYAKQYAQQAKEIEALKKTLDKVIKSMPRIIPVPVNPMAQQMNRMNPRVLMPPQRPPQYGLSESDVDARFNQDPRTWKTPGLRQPYERYGGYGSRIQSREWDTQQNRISLREQRYAPRDPRDQRWSTARAQSSGSTAPRPTFR